MPTRKARPSVELDAFLRAFLAALALKDRPRFRSDAGVLDRALAWTMHDCAKAADRARVEFAFRIREDALSDPGSNLARALGGLVREGIVAPDRSVPNEFEILLGRQDAIDLVTATKIPIPLLERAVNAFRRRLEVAKIRALASQRRVSSPASPRGKS